jgi:predicted DNA-binding WGR domain protein
MLPAVGADLLRQLGKGHAAAGGRDAHNIQGHYTFHPPNLPGGHDATPTPPATSGNRHDRRDPALETPTMPHVDRDQILLTHPGTSKPKYLELRIDGVELHRNWWAGIGKPQGRTNSFGHGREAREALEKVVAEKMRHGYALLRDVVATEPGGVVVQCATRAVHGVVAIALHPDGHTVAVARGIPDRIGQAGSDVQTVDLRTGGTDTSGWPTSHCHPTAPCSPAPSPVTRSSSTTSRPDGRWSRTSSYPAKGRPGARRLVSPPTAGFWRSSITPVASRCSAVVPRPRSPVAHRFPTQRGPGGHTRRAMRHRRLQSLRTVAPLTTRP